MVLAVKNPPATAGDTGDAGSIPDWEDPLEEGMATHSSTLAWGIPWTEETGGLLSIGLQIVGHDWVTNTHTCIYVCVCVCVYSCV